MRANTFSALKHTSSRRRGAHLRFVHISRSGSPGFPVGEMLNIDYATSTRRRRLWPKTRSCAWREGAKRSRSWEERPRAAQAGDPRREPPACRARYVHIGNAPGELSGCSTCCARHSSRTLTGRGTTRARRQVLAERSPKNAGLILMDREDYVAERRSSRLPDTIEATSRVTETRPGCPTAG